MDLLDYVERQAEANMGDRVSVSESLQREANTALAFFLAGAGAALGFCANSIAEGHGRALTVAALAISIHLFVLTSVLISKCLWLREYPARFNEPRNILTAEATHQVDEIRRFEIENLQARITEATKINDTRAMWLNRCRLLAAFVPFIALMGWALGS